MSGPTAVERVPEHYLWARLGRLRASLEAEELEALLALSPTHRAYLSGLTNGIYLAPSGAVLVTRVERPPLYLVSGTDYEECRSALEPLGFEVVAYRSPLAQTLHGTVAEAARRLGLRRLAVERKCLSVEEAENFRAYLSAAGVELELVSGLVDPLREVKDPWELQQLAAANRASALAFAHVLPLVRPGLSEWELALELEYQLRRHGTGSPRLAFTPVVVSGPRSALPHGAATERRLECGDLVTLDFGATCNGYCADITRTLVVGPASPRQHRVYQTVLDAQLAAIATMVPGGERLAATRTAMDLITERGLGDYMAHGAGGHGIGLEVHEGPRTRSAGWWQPGHVVTMEPGVYIPGWGGVRIEDDIVITPRGHENLTDIPKALLEVGA